MSGRDKNGQSDRSVAHGWTAHTSSSGYVVCYHKQNVPLAIQESFQGLREIVLEVNYGQELS